MNVQFCHFEKNQVFIKLFDGLTFKKTVNAPNCQVIQQQHSRNVLRVNSSFCPKIPFYQNHYKWWLCHLGLAAVPMPQKPKLKIHIWLWHVALIKHSNNAFCWATSKDDNAIICVTAKTTRPLDGVEIKATEQKPKLVEVSHIYWALKSR